MTFPPWAENHALQSLNTLGVPSVADFFVSVTSAEELSAALSRAAQQTLPVLVMGEGSNLLLPSRVKGLVIRNLITGIEKAGEDENSVQLTIGAGENWHRLVEHCLARGYAGIENLSLIPGSVGAAPVQNIGAYGVELESVFEHLTAVEVGSGRQTVFSRADCVFGYRDSIFKQRLKDKFVITSVSLRLSKTPAVNLGYPALRNHLLHNHLLQKDAGLDSITPRMVSEAVCAIRRSKLPNPDEIPNAGSFFKNPVVDETQFTRLQQQYPDIVGYPHKDGQTKLAAGWLLEQAGWKGRLEKGLGFHRDQGLVLINPGHHSGEAILAFVSRVQADIVQRFGIQLEIEPACYLPSQSCP